MQIGLSCFLDEQLNSIVESNGRKGKCDITKQDNCVVYDTKEDDYLKAYIEEFIDAFTIAKHLKVTEDDKRVANIATYSYQWGIFAVEEEQIQTILKEICFERYQLEPELFEEKVTIRELFDADKMEMFSLLRTYNWESFCYNIRHVNRFHSQQINLRHLKELLEIMEVEIPSGMQVLYRARICDEDNFQIGYRVKEMGAPPVKFATAGRTNSEGIQCLYLADSEETTFHEVRARDYDYVSVGAFEQIKDIKIIDLNLFEKISPFSESNFNMAWFAINIEIIRKIGNEIAKPMRRFDSSLEYIPTQYICDYIKHLGYDGIKFRSTLMSGGNNYAIFYENKFKCSEVNVRQIGSIEYNLI